VKIVTQWLRDYLPGLGVSDRELADDLTLRGIAVEGVFDLGAGNGSLFEMDITTNRVDAMNHYGVAREAAAIYGLPLVALDSHVSEARHGAPGVSVSIEAPELCGRFTARVLRGVRIQASSGVVASRFGLLEQKLISNAVDATNYALLAMGQPTHAFDLDKLEGGIVVRRARKGERLKLLDGTERTLDTDDLVVADERKALGLAGVMGGWDSMITAETKNVLIEAAWFDPAAVRRSSRRHGIHTDASHRFERGADFNAAPIASAMVTNVILEAGC
jgi:phenylalanyl-tRNA synthetase beta chain